MNTKVMGRTYRSKHHAVILFVKSHSYLSISLTGIIREAKLSSC